MKLTNPASRSLLCQAGGSSPAAERLDKFMGNNAFGSLVDGGYQVWMTAAQ